MNSLEIQSSQGTSAPDQPSGLSRRWLALAGAAILGLTGVVGWRAWQGNVAPLNIAPREESQPVQAPIISTVTALGRLEPQGEVINLTAPTSVQGARLEELPVKVGDRVTAGQVIAILDNRDRLQAALQKAEQRVQIAQANLAKVEAGAKSGEIDAQMAEISRIEAAEAADVEAQRATIARLEAEVNNARADYERYSYLYEQGALSASERDSRQLSFTTTQRRLEEAQAGLSRIQSTSRQQLNQARATLDRIQEVRPVDITAAEAEVSSALADVAEAQANLDQAYVRSPSPGQILKIYSRPGESIATEGIAAIGQTDQMMAVAEVYQSDITKIQPGQPTEITSPVLSQTLAGTVERVGLQIERQQVVNEDPAANIDAKVVEVYIRLNPEANEAVAALTNLQVTATIQTD